MFGNDFTINNDAVALDADAIARYTDDSLHIVSQNRPVVRTIVTLWIERIAGILEDDDVATLDFSLGQERKRHARRKDEFVHEQMIADRDRVLHRACRDLHCLNDEGHTEQRHDDRHHRRLEVLAYDLLGRTLRLHRSDRLLVVAVTVK